MEYCKVFVVCCLQLIAKWVGEKKASLPPLECFYRGHTKKSCSEAIRRIPVARWREASLSLSGIKKCEKSIIVLWETDAFWSAKFAQKNLFCTVRIVLPIRPQRFFSPFIFSSRLSRRTILSRKKWKWAARGIQISWRRNAKVFLFQENAFEIRSFPLTTKKFIPDLYLGSLLTPALSVFLIFLIWSLARDGFNLFKASDQSPFILLGEKRKIIM